MVVKDVFTDAELSPMKDELDAMVDEVAQRLYKAGKIKGESGFQLLLSLLLLQNRKAIR